MEHTFRMHLLTEAETRATLALVYPQIDTFARPALAENAFEIACADASHIPSGITEPAQPKASASR
jgi:hypothetical protein